MKLTSCPVSVIAALGVVAQCVAAGGAPRAQEGKPQADSHILLFVGAGTSPGDVVAVETLLRKQRFNYSTANSPQLNAMSAHQLRGYRLLIVPGGSFVQIGTNLTPDAAANIRNAVRGGLNYLGLCAGAFFAGNSPYNGLNLTGGVRFNFYALENQGIRKSAVPISVAGASTSDQYWEDGPQLSGWGDVVAKYPDGTPAIVQGNAGDGWVILTGTHPEAPESWRRGMAFGRSASENNAYAASLLDAAMNGRRLKHF
jgi:glutamine amidotransferase-like uncharacterized protein